MVAKRNFLIMNLMRVLTPEEINELTTTYYGERRVSLTSLLDKDFLGIESDSGDSGPEQEDDGKAKILPFTGEFQESVQESEEQIVHGQHRAGAGVQVLFRKLYGISENSFNSVGAGEVSVEIEQAKKGTSLFILDEKLKLETSQKKLKSKEVLSTYKKVASMDIESEKNHKDDLGWSSHSGLLVNKKHY